MSIGISRRTLLRGVGATTGAATLPLLRSDSGRVSARQDEPRRLRATLVANLSQIDPNLRRGIHEMNVHRSLYNCLLNYDENGELIPELAESYESDDAQTYIFHLRQGVKWHDGVEFTAHDIDATFNRIADPNLGARRDQRDFVAQMTSRSVVDDYTYQWTFAEPSVVAVHQLTKLPIVREDFDPASPVGTGAFVFDEWILDQKLSLSRNENYWQDGKPRVSGIDYSFITDEQQQINKLISGETDILATPAVPQMKLLAETVGVVNHVLPPDATPNFYFLLMNTARAPFNDVRVRQAVNMAIDREALLAITEGFGEIRSNPVPEWHWAFNPSAPSYNTKDIDQARALVEEAGATGTAPVFKYYTEFAELGLAAQIIQANLAEIGIQLQLERIDLGGYAEQVITNFDYDMSMTIYVPLFDPEDMLATVAYRYDSVALQWENAEFLNALNNANATLDPDVRLAEFGRAQEIWMNEVPGAVLGMTPARVASRDNVQDVVVATGNYALYEDVILS